MPDVGKRLVGPQFLTTSSATLYTAPAGTTTVVRSVHINNTSASAQTVTLALNATASTAGSQILSAYPVPANGAVDISCMWVLGAADFISGLTATASTVTIYISGVESS